MREAPLRRSVTVHHVDFSMAVALGREHDPLAIGRPGRPPIASLMSGEPDPVRSKNSTGRRSSVAGKVWRPSVFAMNQRITAEIDQHEMKAVLKPADEHVEGITIVADRLIVSILLRSRTLRLQAASR